MRPFQQVDVFAHTPLSGNPLAVVLNADGLTETQMQTLAHWTNLSETVFLCAPSHIKADYDLRIFTPARELPFAGHPTLGAAFAWMTAGGTPTDGRIVQNCGAGLIDIETNADQLFFRAPPLLRSGPIQPDEIARVQGALGLKDGDIIDAAHADNGPGWMAFLLRDAETMMQARPDYAQLDGRRIGLVAATGHADPQFGLRAFSASGYEDPVTGSLQAGVAQWLRDTGRASGQWTTCQGAAVGRDGRVSITERGSDIWVGGHVLPIISGTIAL